MAKQGQHKNDARDQRHSPGRNNPKQSMTITTGTYKKRGTYDEQARQHKDTDPTPQMQQPKWDPDSREDRDMKKTRSGSDSNASNATKGH